MSKCQFDIDGAKETLAEKLIGRLVVGAGCVARPVLDCAIPLLHSRLI